MSAIIPASVEQRADRSFRVLVTGGRTFDHPEPIYAMLDTLLASMRDVEAQAGALPHTMWVIQGGARGADEIARTWAKDRPGVLLITEHADWTKHGRGAGPKRNQAMLDKYDPDLVVAAPGGRGTADMVKRATLARLPILLAVPAAWGRPVQ